MIIALYRHINNKDWSTVLSSPGRPGSQNLDFKGEGEGYPSSGYEF